MNRFVIAEPKLCIGCNTCMAACSMVHKAVGLQAHPRLTVVRTAQLSAPVICRHCEDAPCARVCPVNAITHQDDSIVLNETLCIGCKLCAIACPFGAITPSGTPCSGVVATSPLYQSPDGSAPQSEVPSDSPATLSPMLAWEPGVRAVAVKCDLCAFLPDGPECVRVCPTAALHSLDNQALDLDAAVKRDAAMTALGEQVSLPSSQEQK
jgi:hydrogenase-4 component A